MGGLAKIIIKNAYDVGAYVQGVNEDFLLISIMSPELDFPNIPDNPHCKGILRLKFHDVLRKRQGMKPFQKKHAKRIKHFISTHHASLLICHCRSGISRSPSVGAVLAMVHGLDATPFFRTGGFVPNLRVFKILLSIYGLHDVADEVKKHKETWIQHMRDKAGI